MKKVKGMSRGQQMVQAALNKQLREQMMYINSYVHWKFYTEHD